jgi:hypothetical protein
MISAPNAFCASTVDSGERKNFCPSRGRKVGNRKALPLVWVGAVLAEERWQGKARYGR